MPTAPVVLGLRHAKYGGPGRGRGGGVGLTPANSSARPSIATATQADAVLVGCLGTPLADASVVQGTTEGRLACRVSPECAGFLS